MSPPTVVLVHGAAESASGNGVLTRRQAAGLTTVAVADPATS